jgi:uncharacterized secreted repeat protein (TIGR03808 family)
MIKPLVFNRRGVLGLAAGALWSETAVAADQTEKLQRLFDKAARTTGHVVLEAGTYLVSTLKVTATLKIEGVRGRTVLKSSAGEPILHINDAANITISGVVFDSGNMVPHDGAGGAGGTSDTPAKFQVLATQCADILVEECVFQNAATCAVGFDACTGRVVGNVISGVGQAGILAGRFYGAYAAQKTEQRGLLISGNHLSDIGNNGIVLVHAGAKSEEDGSIVSDNHIQGIRSGSGNGQHGNGIYVFSSDNVIVSGNRITDTVYSGIRCTSAEAVQIENNSISRSSEVAIFVEFAFKSVVVSGNTVEDAFRGIELSGGDGVVGFTGLCGTNIVRNINRPTQNADGGKHIGINITSNNTTGVGNVVDGVGTNSAGPGIGILVQDWSASHYHSVQNNMIHAAPYGIGVVLGYEGDGGAKAISITGNTISAATAAPFQEFNPAFEPESGDGLKSAGLELSGNVIVK